MRKLAYLPHGLAVILGFIGSKLILDTLHDNDLPFLNNGQPVPVPTVNSVMSLAVIVNTLLVAALASAWKARRLAARTQLRPPSTHSLTTPAEHWAGPNLAD